MNRTPLLCAALVAAISVVTPVRAQLVEDYRFKGRIVSTDGEPIKGAKITLRDVRDGSLVVIKVKDNGKFDKRMIKKGLYDATFEAEGYEPQTKRLDWTVAASDTIVREAEVTLMSVGERERRENEAAMAELGMKKSGLDREAYDALASGDCVLASNKANELMKVGAGEREFAVRFVLARCHATAGRNVEAAAEYQRVIELKPDLYAAQYDLANVLLAEGDDAGAMTHYEKAAELQPTNVEPRYNIGAMLFKRGSFDDARPWMEAVVELRPDHADAHKALGFIFLSIEDKDFQRAKQMLSRYLELRPDASDHGQVSAIIGGIN